jgi:arylsulfatase A
MHAARTAPYALLLLSTISCSAPEPSGGAPTTPKVPRGVVLIFADDVGVEAFECYGGESYSTPRIDALAGEGMRFTEFHAQPLCTPSRVKLLTGRSNLRNYRRFSVLDPEEVTLADLLGQAGYTTAAVGKWQLHGAAHYGEWRGIGARPEEAGFDRWCLWQVEELGSRYWEPLLEIDGELQDTNPGDYGPREFLDYAIQFLEEHRDEPFLLFYPMALVHAPFVTTPDSADADSKDKQANFADMVAEMDRTVGSLVDALDRLGMSEETLLLFTSDNGTDKRIVSEAWGQEIKGGKALPLNRGTHVPLIARWPGVVPAGSTCTDLMDLSDILPTLVELCAATRDPGVTLDGRSFASRLQGRPHEPREWISVYCNPRPGNPKFVPTLFVRDARFKLYEDGRFLDLTSDAEEQRPLDIDALGPDAAASLASLSEAIASLPPPNDDLGGSALRARRSVEASVPESTGR